ncbi:hypothetical protein F0U59_48410 [Archangium gephyra]|nr:hypothetical protein F0U59_48410 [Archangium gephyra]
MSRIVRPAAVSLPVLLCSLAACEPPPKPPLPPPVPNVTLSWVGVAEDGFCTSGIRNLGATHQGDNPEQVMLLRNSQPVANLVPPYTYTVDCDRDPEGSHSFQLQAKIGTHTFFSTIRTLSIDRTRPSVVETSPNASTALRKDTPITFRFSEPVHGDVSTATSLRDETGPLAHTASLSAGGTLLTILPKERLRAPAELQATLTGVLSDAAGHPLKESSVTMSWSLLPFIPTEASLSSDEPVALARGSSGTPWMASIDNPTGVTVRRWAADGWKTFGTDLPVDGFNGKEIALTLDANEAPFVAILEDPPGSPPPFVRVHRGSGGGWEQLGGNIAVSPTLFSSEWLSIGVDSRGNPSVAWYEYYAVQVRRWTGTGWEALGAPIGTSDNDTQSPVLAVDSRDRVVLAYSQQPTGSTYNRVIVQRWEGGTWVPLGTSLASTAVGSISGIDLVIGPDDAPVVAWIESNKDDDVFAARWTAGKWEMSPLLGKSYRYDYDMSVAADGDGRVLVAWWNDDPVELDRPWVYTARFESGAWSTGVRACMGENPRATFTPDGTALLWVDLDTGYYRPFIED